MVDIFSLSCDQLRRSISFPKLIFQKTRRIYYVLVKDVCETMFTVMLQDLLEH